MAASSHLWSAVCRNLLYRPVICACRVTAIHTQRCSLPVTCITFQQQRSMATKPTDAAKAVKPAVVINNDLLSEVLSTVKDDMPIERMPDPFQKEHKRCILCVHNLDVNYKNVRLLSQFVSPYTGRIYGRAVTGLCIAMQRRVSAAIIKSRAAGFMPYLFKNMDYLEDPRLFDPFKQAK